MNPNIASIENLIAADPGSRNVFALVLADQLRLAAQSLRQARRVGIVSGFYIPEARAGETDGPPGAKIVGQALQRIGITVDYITDRWNEKLFSSLGIETITDTDRYFDDKCPTHLLSIERVGRAADGRYRNMHGRDITDTTPPLDELFLEATARGLTTIGIGDGGNEIGMGKVFAAACEAIDHGTDVTSTITTDFCIVAGVSNWGAYGLAGALSVLEGRDLLPSAEEAARDLEHLVRHGGAVDGVTHRAEPTVDGLTIAHSLRMLESIRRQIIHSPLGEKQNLQVGVLGFGEAGRAATTLLCRRNHRVRVSDVNSVTLETGIELAGIETGKHTAEFFDECDLVVASPGIHGDAPIRNELHLRGIPIISELELGYKFCDRPIIAVTGTIGKRTTVELMKRIFQAAGRDLTIGGNRGLPLSAIVTSGPDTSEAGPASQPIALAVSSFQLESVVDFRPHIAVMLNINQAHLDRHGSVAEYVRIKSRIFMSQRPQDILILNYDDKQLRPLARKHSGRVLFVSERQPVDRGAWIAGGKIMMNIDSGLESLGEAAPPFPENLLSALVAARLCGISGDKLTAALDHVDD